MLLLLLLLEKDNAAKSLFMLHKLGTGLPSSSAAILALVRAAATLLLKHLHS